MEPQDEVTGLAGDERRDLTDPTGPGSTTPRENELTVNQILLQ